MRTLCLLVALAAALAGCASGPSATEESVPVKASAESAGAVDGPAPAAPKEAYAATASSATGSGESESLTVFPVLFPTNAAKAPFVEEYTGAFTPNDCSPNGQLLPSRFIPGGAPKWWNVSEAFAPGDVFSYAVTLTWTNTDDSWADLHLGNTFGGASDYWQEPTNDKRGEVVLNFTGQGYFGPAGRAMVGADCWYGFTKDPIPFVIKLELTFAEGALPASTPALITVPDNATRLVARGVAVNPDEGVLSHFRVFKPDDTLLCECALDPMTAAATLPLIEGGDYVIIVDHTTNGFVSFGLDVVSPTPMKALSHKMTPHVIFKDLNENGFSKEAAITFDSVPLSMRAWVFPEGFSERKAPSAGAGSKYEIHVTSPRGEVLRQKMAAYATYRVSVPGVFSFQDWRPVAVPGGEWEFYTDHHAYSYGTHLVNVKADQIRGDVVLFVQQYDRAAAN